MMDPESRIERLIERVRRLAELAVPSELESVGDDALGRLEHEVNRLIRSAQQGMQERLLFEVGPVVVFRWQNKDGWPVEYVSANVATLTGYPLEDFASGRRPYASLIHKDDLPRVFEEVTSNSASGVSWFVHEPYRLLRPDGKELWIADYTVVLRDASGTITHYFGYIMDITEQIERFERLRVQERAIEQLSSPILQVGRGVLAMPVLNRLHGAQAARVTDALLDAIARTGARTAILDLTGLTEIDAPTVESILRTGRAVGLLGCRCVLSGISPAIATLIVESQITVHPLSTVATLEDALNLALKR